MSRQLGLLIVVGLLWVAGPLALGRAQEKGDDAAAKQEGGTAGGLEPARDRAGVHVGPGGRHRGRPREARAPGTSWPPPEASGRPRTRARPGRRSSTDTARTRSAAWPSIPSNHLVVWVGTGENNSQRSVGYGDGLYKSIDGGASFTKVGLERSEHIAKVLIDPTELERRLRGRAGTALERRRRPGTVQDHRRRQDLEGRALDQREHGRDRRRLRSAQPRRALCRGLPAAAARLDADRRRARVGHLPVHRRRRNAGGRSTRDCPTATRAGSAWRSRPSIPTSSTPRSRPPRGQSGFFRSENGGESWAKRSGYIATSPQYYQEIVADPHVFDRVYAMDTLLHVSEDGGKSFRPLGERWKHVDNHALWIDPDDSDHLIVGCDGGLYETWDRGQTYRYTANLPITQFYKIAVDNDAPFYNVYGGTQDNATQGGPSRTNNVHGIRNSDWFVTVFGDGFDPVIDPTNPNIIYSQWQYGGLVRYDRRSGERIDIKPQEDKNGPPLRWNWDSALILSPHSPTRLYYGSQILFRSDDRGDTWKAISPDLTRNIDRNKLKVMGRVWSVDAVAKNDSTSFYGSIVALAESPLVEGLIYAGTDDGLIQVTEDGGQHWRKVENFPFTSKPADVYVSDIETSRHDPNTVYACFDNHQNGDFKPYLLRSTDRGKSWTNIGGDLPERGIDLHDRRRPRDARPALRRHRVRRLRHPRRRPALAPLEERDAADRRPRPGDPAQGERPGGRHLRPGHLHPRRLQPAPPPDASRLLDKPAAILPIKKALLYIPAAPLAGGEKAYQGASFYTAPNPPFGATFTYYLKDALKTKKAARREQEQKLERDGKDVSYPSWDALKAEDREEPAAVILTIKNAAGQVVRRLGGPGGSGLHRVTWDLRWPGYRPVTGGRAVRRGDDDDEFVGGGRNGPLALPGKYTVTLEKREEQGTKELAPADRRSRSSP